MTFKIQNHSFAKTKSKGFTLIEIMIALAIMGTAIAAVLFYQGKAEGTQRALAMTQDTTLLASKIRSLYSPQNSYKAINSGVEEELHKMGILPSNMTYDSDTITDAFGNKMEFTGGVSTFTVSVGGTTGPLRPEECAALATGARSNAMAITVGKDAVGTADEGVATGSFYKDLKGVLSTANLALGCQEENPVVVMQFR